MITSRRTDMLKVTRALLFWVLSIGVAYSQTNYDPLGDLTGLDDAMSIISKHVDDTPISGNVSYGTLKKLQEQVEANPDQNILIQETFYSRNEIETYRRAYAELPQRIQTDWHDYFQLLGIESAEEQAAIRSHLTDWKSYDAYRSSLATNECVSESLETQAVPEDSEEPQQIIGRSSLASSFTTLVHEPEQDIDKQSETNVFRKAATQFRPIAKPNLHKRESAFAFKAKQHTEEVEVVKQVAKAEGKKAGRKLGRRARGFFNKKVKQTSKIKQLAPVLAKVKSKVPAIDMEPKAGAAEVKVEVSTSCSAEDRTIAAWLAEKRQYNARNGELAINEIELRAEIETKLNDVDLKLTKSKQIKQRLIRMLRNKAYKEKPIYFAENSTHGSSSKYMKGVHNILVTNFDLAYGYKKPVPRDEWPALIKTLPSAYLDLCAGGLGGLGSFLSTDSKFSKWVWLADENDNYYSVGTMPVIMFRNRFLAAGKALLKLNALKNKNTESVLAAQLMKINLSDIAAVYYPIVMHINHKNRDFLSWVERDPTADQPFRIRLGPESLRGKRLQEIGLHGRRLRQGTLQAIKQYEQQHPKVDALLNLRFVARGVRNICTMEVINLTRTEDLERETDGFRFSFGTTVLKKKKPLTHNVLLGDESLPRMKKDYLDRAVANVSGSREGHSESLHIDPKVMYDYGMKYLVTDIEKISRQSASFR